MKHFLGLLSGVFLLVLLSCNNNSSENKITETTKEEVVVDKIDTPENLIVKEEKVEAPVISLDSNLTLLTKEILLLFKNKDYKAVAEYIHPEKGLLFSPYGFIDKGNAVQLTRENFLNALNDEKRIKWGSYDGSGDPINLTLKEYISKFVYNADYLNSEKFGINKIIGTGNSLNNLKKFFPDLNFTESYFSGFKKELNGMDWTTLRLVFEKSGDKYYLRGIVHDKWTV